ncbi:hypothetical protein ACHAWF_015440 [Thalassiosira exigua]
MRCTCAPHPRVDLPPSLLFAEGGASAAVAVGRCDGGRADDVDASSSSLRRRIRDEIRSACRSHGCFHLAVDLSTDLSDDAAEECRSRRPPRPLQFLAKSGAEVEDEIEALFSPQFLEEVVSRRPTGAAEGWEEICDGGQIEVLSPDGATTTATFRGRMAESGDAEGAVAEPKLSWEFRRCLGGGGGGGGGDDDEDDGGEEERRKSRSGDKPNETCTHDRAAPKRTLTALVSNGVHDYAQAADQKAALDLLNDLCIPYSVVDGMDPSQKDRRDELFAISGIRGNYPQFFSSTDGGDEDRYLGNYDWLNGLGDLPAALYDQGLSAAAETIGPSPNAGDDRGDRTRPRGPDILTPGETGPSAKARLTVLVSKGVHDCTQAADQKAALNLLDDLRISYSVVDGMDPSQRDRRDELFAVSGVRGNYPQIFSSTEAGDGYLGSYEWLNALQTEASEQLARKTRGTWRSLPAWTEALRSAASTVVSLLGVPPGVVLREGSCRCLGGDGEGCNVDLLRAFRYDAVPPPQCGDLDQEGGSEESAEEPTLGSSAHTDWGTLTVVWQDAKGGLQTWCHECQRWSDVDASPPGGDGDETVGAQGDDGKVGLFVHVGDFLSLATMRSDDDCDGGGGNGGGGGRIPAWPSPRHRLLCPVSTGEGDDEVGGCRRSLVYFAYPPPGISLEDARKVVAPLAHGDGLVAAVESGGDCKGGIYGRYSLLHDQSAAVGTKNGLDADRISHRTHERIKNVPFDEVVREKWSQVQRGAA